jgi:hypothetical protein
MLRWPRNIAFQGNSDEVSSAASKQFPFWNLLQSDIGLDVHIGISRLILFSWEILKQQVEV